MVNESFSFDPFHLNHGIDIALQLSIHLLFHKNALVMIGEVGSNSGGMCSEIGTDPLITELHIRTDRYTEASQCTNCSTVCTIFIDNGKSPLQSPRTLY